jgi:small subunit ribosomal protein S7
MRKTTPKRIARTPDPRFNDALVTRFVNNIMNDGKKSIAFAIFYDAIDIVEKRTEENGHEVWKRALENVSPGVEVKSRRVGGATFQIPMEIRPDRRIALGIKWLIMYSRKRNEKSMAQRLASEIVAASKGEGSAHKKKEDTHRMAEANKAFSHFRF